MGRVVQYLADPDQSRAQRDLQALISMLTTLADVHPAATPPAADQEARRGHPALLALAIAAAQRATATAQRENPPGQDVAA